MTAAVLGSHNYADLIGCDFIVADSDNRSFAAFLPRRGTAARQIALEDWGSDWLMLRLHNPFEYQLGSLDTGSRAVQIEQLLVRSRWVGRPIGSQSTSVFVLLDADQLLDTNQRFRSADFLHVTWAMISRVDSSSPNA